MHMLDQCNTIIQSLTLLLTCLRSATATLPACQSQTPPHGTVVWTPPPRQSLPDRFHKAMLTSWYKRKIEATKCRSHVKTKLYMCAGESTRLGTLTLASGSAPCLFGGHGRATLSAKGTQLDYTRIMVTRLSEQPFYCVQLLSARKRKHGKQNLLSAPPRM